MCNYFAHPSINIIQAIIAASNICIFDLLNINRHWRKVLMELIETNPNYAHYRFVRHLTNDNGKSYHLCIDYPVAASAATSTTDEWRSSIIAAATRLPSCCQFDYAAAAISYAKSQNIELADSYNAYDSDYNSDYDTPDEYASPNSYAAPDESAKMEKKVIDNFQSAITSCLTTLLLHSRESACEFLDGVLTINNERLIIQFSHVIEDAMKAAAEQLLATGKVNSQDDTIDKILNSIRHVHYGDDGYLIEYNQTHSSLGPADENTATDVVFYSLAYCDFIWYPIVPDELRPIISTPAEVAIFAATVIDECSEVDRVRIDRAIDETLSTIPYENIREYINERVRRDDRELAARYVNVWRNEQKEQEEPDEHPDGICDCEQ